VKLKKIFHISRKPVVLLSKAEHSHDLDNGGELPRFYGQQRLIAIARDPWTLFAYWNVDWASIFKDAAPFGRQVHLRIHSGEGLTEKEATVEPMAGTHYVTMSQRHRSCCIEIGYYQPADVWNSVAISKEVMMPPSEISESEDVDIAAIPFHLSFQQLVELYGANDNALATLISRFQTRAAGTGRHDTLSSQERRILQRVEPALSEITDSRRVFNQVDGEKLKKRAKTLLGSGTTSPSRGFGGDWTSAGS
jgi:hypothetical protein